MPRYLVTTLTDDHRLERHEVEASSSESAQQQLQRSGVIIVRTEKPIQMALPTLLRPRALELLLFVQELTSLLEAGLTLFESVETLLEKETQPQAVQILQHVTGMMQEGHPFSEALASRRDIFGDILVATIRASERTGDVLPALKRYLAYQKQLHQLKRKIISATIYPAILLLTGAGVLLFMLLYLVPRFSVIYNDVGADLPLASRLLLQWGHLLQQHTTPVLMTLASSIIFFAWLLMQPFWRTQIELVAWKLRGIGPWLRRLHLSRFYRALAMLLQSGMPLPTALHMTHSLLPKALASALPGVQHDISEGQPLSCALERNALLTPVARRLIRVGEKSGELATLLERTADFHDEETTLWMERFSRIFEPLLMLLIGFLTGLVVVLMYLPIFQMAQSWQT